MEPLDGILILLGIFLAIIFPIAAWRIYQDLSGFTQNSKSSQYNYYNT